MPRKPGVIYPGDGQYDRGIAKEFGPLASERLRELGISQTELVGRISAELRRKGRPASYRPQTLGRVLSGKASTYHLKPWIVGAICRALEITDKDQKARMYAAAGHMPDEDGMDLEQYAKAFEGLEARAS